MKLSAGLLLGALAATATAAVEQTKATGKDIDYSCDNIILSAGGALGSIVCKTLRLVGSVTQPTCDIGKTTALLKTATFSDCTFNGVPVTITSPGSWALAITEKPAEGSDEWKAQLSNVIVDIDAAGLCKFTVGGVINGVFDEGDQTFDPEDTCEGLKVTKITSSPDTGCIAAGLKVGATIGLPGSIFKSLLDAKIHLNLLNIVDADVKVGL